MEATALIDAMYANVGTNMKISLRNIPTVNVTLHDDEYVVVYKSLEQTNTVLDASISNFVIENGQLLDRFTSFELEHETKCDEWSDLTSHQVCYTCPGKISWPFKKLQFKVTEKP